MNSKKWLGSSAKYSFLIPSYLSQLLSCIRNAARQDNGPITPRVGIYELEDSVLFDRLERIAPCTLKHKEGGC